MLVSIICFLSNKKNINLHTWTIVFGHFTEYRMCINCEYELFIQFERLSPIYQQISSLTTTHFVEYTKTKKWRIGCEGFRCCSDAQIGLNKAFWVDSHCLCVLFCRSHNTSYVIIKIQYCQFLCKIQKNRQVTLRQDGPYPLTIFSMDLKSRSFCRGHPSFLEYTEGEKTCKNKSWGSTAI